jgi:hypothetical protein
VVYVKRLVQRCDLFDYFKVLVPSSYEREDFGKID